MRDYTTQAMRTAADLGSRKADFVHGVLGLLDEIQELQDAPDVYNVREELGDLCWFVALCGTALCFDPFATRPSESLVPFEDIADIGAEMQARANILAGLAKRWHAYGQEPSQETVAGYLWLLIDLAEVKAGRCGWTLEDVQASNIRKLRARFPEHFAAEMALHRNIEAEREAMGAEEARV